MKVRANLNRYTAIMFSVLVLNIAFIAKSLPSISSLILVNAESNKDIRTLKESDVIDLDNLGANQLTVRANTSFSTGGSVRFVMTGALSINHVENISPYTLFGDDKGDFAAGSWNPPPLGSYTLTCTPYSDARGGGSTGASYTIHFSIKNSGVNVSSRTTGGKVVVLPKRSSIYLPDLRELGINPGDTIVIPSGTYTGITIGNIHGTADKKVKIVNAPEGKVVSRYLRLHNATHFTISGSGSSDQYGFLLGAKDSNASLSISEATSDFEVQRVECQDSTCGFFFKVNSHADKPLTIYPNWTMKNLNIHHNFLHNIHGEGMYIGHTGGNGGQGGNPLIPIRLDHVKIHHNRVESTDWDGIQLATAREGAEIYGNVVRNYGLANKATQQAGILLGGSTTGKIYDNWIENGTGNGIEYFGYGKGEISGNTLISAGTLSTSDTIYINQVPNTVETDSALSIFVDSNKILNSGRTPIRNGNYFKRETSGRITNNVIFDTGTFDKRHPMIASNADDEILNNLQNPSIPKPVPTDPNTPPNANAGKDQIISLNSQPLVLNGSGTDTDGAIYAYRWSKVSGGAASFSSSGPSTKVTNLSKGSYIFRLTINDDKAAVATDDVHVTVQ